MVKTPFLSMTLCFLAILILFSCQQFGNRSMEKEGKTSTWKLITPLNFQNVAIK